MKVLRRKNPNNKQNTQNQTQTTKQAKVYGMFQFFFSLQKCLWNGLSYKNLHWKGSHVVQCPAQAAPASLLKINAPSNLIHPLGLHQFTSKYKKHDSSQDSLGDLE